MQHICPTELNQIRFPLEIVIKTGKNNGRSKKEPKKNGIKCDSRR